MGHSRDKLTWWQRTTVELVWCGCWLVGILPHWLRYHVLQDIIYFVVYRCFRYRVKVVTANLHNSFPERPIDEIKRIRRAFYRNLSEIFVATVSQAAMSDDDCRRQVRIRNLEALQAEIRGRDALLSTAHFGCWEYDSFLALYTREHYVAAVYHPLENRVIDTVYMRLRHRRNIRLIPMKEIIRYYIDHRLPAGAPGQRIGIGLIADQNPPLRPNSHWFRFLNQDTVFFDGIEKMALKFRLPVYFCRQRRVRRGYYELEFLRLYDGEEPVGPNEITERYVRQLEQDIMADPGMWLWSHRRWKHRRTECQS
ncbi:lysophospholipid acyltransferase family protein [uncultured Alistipes sp.]|uniref:lysophospholipid acyltransferase family protein n=1 Tax=uncultured Alistipes sp. TaxID=538949 RepID=UPI0026131126|nr:lysophospholipid acyltransferase family protein [uncultured Alistipes sp.]